MQGAPQRGGGSGMMWALLGCGGLFLVLTCFGGMGAAFYLFRAKSERAAEAVAERRAIVEEERAAEERALMERERAAAEQGQPGDPLAAAGPVNVAMTVTSSDLRQVSVGTSCVFEVGMHDLEAGPMCQAHVTCNGVRLYGDTDTNGYFPCTLTATSVTGADTGTTSADTDAAISIDTSGGTIAISDDRSGHLGAFHVTGTALVGMGGLGLHGVGTGGS